MAARLGHRLEFDEAVYRTAALAEQVAQSGRQRRTGRTCVPAETVCFDPAEHSAEMLVLLADGDLMAQLGQPYGAGETTSSTKRAPGLEGECARVAFERCLRGGHSSSISRNYFFARHVCKR